MKITLKQILDIIANGERVEVYGYKDGQYSLICKTRQKEYKEIEQYFSYEVNELYTDTTEWGDDSIFCVSINL